MKHMHMYAHKWKWPKPHCDLISCPFKEGRGEKNKNLAKMGVPEHWLPKILWLNAIFIHFSRRNRADANDAHDRFVSQLRAPPATAKPASPGIWPEYNHEHYRLHQITSTFQHFSAEYSRMHRWYWHLISTQKYRSHVINEHTLSSLSAYSGGSPTGGLANEELSMEMRDTFTLQHHILGGYHRLQSFVCHFILVLQNASAESGTFSGLLPSRSTVPSRRVNSYQGIRGFSRVSRVPLVTASYEHGKNIEHLTSDINVHKPS
jgi:hypothetical protein